LRGTGQLWPVIQPAEGHLIGIAESRNGALVIDAIIGLVLFLLFEALVPHRMVLALMNFVAERSGRVDT
jgi:hypothetical protein